MCVAVWVQFAAVNLVQQLMSQPLTVDQAVAYRRCLQGPLMELAANDAQGAWVRAAAMSAIAGPCIEWLEAADVELLSRMHVVEAAVRLLRRGFTSLAIGRPAGAAGGEAVAASLHDHVYRILSSIRCFLPDSPLPSLSRAATEALAQVDFTPFFWPIGHVATLRHQLTTSAV